ncbi:lipopolysaccharide biosynthesis protein [Pseudosulfitobacter pseudonitzschiae]|uniref:lipopolysaccharide biosynthesis protein n=1 Tax=Pseudosulfitobacter pseudonitzschiae TaxID=1402135 RepID=UPI003B77BB20
MIDHVAYMLISMITLAILLRRFGLETVGLWTLLAALLNYGRIGDVWSKGLLSFIGEARGRNMQSDAAGYASTTVTTGAAGYLLLMSIGGAAVYSFAPHIVPPEHVELVRQNLPVMVTAYWLIAFAGNFGLAFVGFGFIWISAVQRIGGALLFFMGALALDPSQGLLGILTIQILQGAAMLAFGIIVFYGFIARNIHHMLWERQKFNQLFRFGSKLFFVGGIQLAVEPMIKLLVSQFGGLALVAVLEIVMRLVQGFRGLIISIGQVLVTSFSRLRGGYLTADSAPLRDNFAQAMQLFLGGSLVAFSLLFSVAPLVSLMFLNAEAQAGSGTSFLTMLWVLGTAWFINTVASPGYFLLMSLRASRQLFFSVMIRAGLIAVLGFPFGSVFGLDGIMVVVLLAHIISSTYLFFMASKAIHLPISKGLFEFLRSDPLIFIPFVWATGLTALWIVAPSVLNQPFMLGAYAIGLLSTGLLVLRYSHVRFLLRTVGDLRP